jgi:hypothetical protein
MEGESNFQDFLIRALDYYTESVGGEHEREDEYTEHFSLRSFEEAGILTGNKGLVLRFDDGSEFQLTIVQSKAGRFVAPCLVCGAYGEHDDGCMAVNAEHEHSCPGHPIADDVDGDGKPFRYCSGCGLVIE